MNTSGSSNHLASLAARDAVNPTRAWLNIWHARVAYLAAVAEHPNKYKHNRTPFNEQCKTLLSDVERERARLTEALSAMGGEIATHALVVQTVRDLEGLTEKLSRARLMLDHQGMPTGDESTEGQPAPSL